MADDAQDVINRAMGGGAEERQGKTRGRTQYPAMANVNTENLARILMQHRGYDKDRAWRIAVTMFGGQGKGPRRGEGVEIG